jgi:hypothetical protein
MESGRLVFQTRFNLEYSMCEMSDERTDSCLRDSGQTITAALVKPASTAVTELPSNAYIFGNLLLVPSMRRLLASASNRDEFARGSTPLPLGIEDRQDSLKTRTESSAIHLNDRGVRKWCKCPTPGKLRPPDEELRPHCFHVVTTLGIAIIGSHGPG